MLDIETLENTMRSSVQPYPPRYTVKDSETALEIVTAGYRSQKSVIAFAIAVSIFWLVFGVFIAYFIVSDVTSTYPFTMPKIIYFGAVEWLLGSIFWVAIFLWSFTFKEIIQVRDQDIVVEQQSRILNRSKRYLAEHVKDLRVSTSFGNKFLAFDYGARTIRFGRGLDEAEARQIIAIIQEKFPTYSAKNNP
jgi:hypothetical protein